MRISRALVSPVLMNRGSAILLPLAVWTVAGMPASISAQESEPTTSVALSAIDSKSPLMVAEFLKGCDLASRAVLSMPADAVAKFCRLKLYNLDNVADIPSIQDFRCVLLRPLRGARDPKDVCFSNSVNLYSNNPLAGMTSFQSVFLGAATDVLFARAQDAVKQDVLELVGKRFCQAGTSVGTSAISVDSLLKESCASLRKFAEPSVEKRYSSPLPSLVGIRASFRKDLLAAPERVELTVSRIRTSLATNKVDTTKRDTQYVSSVYALVAMRVARGLAAQQGAWTVLRSVADSMGLEWVNPDITKAASDNVWQADDLRAFTVAVGIASTLDGAWKGAGETRSLTPSDVVGRSEDIIRTTLVSYNDIKAEGWPAVLRNGKGAWDGLEPKMFATLGALENVGRYVQAFAALPGLEEFRQADAATRRELIEQQASVILPLLIDLVPSKSVDARTRALVAQLAPLSVHLAREDYAAIVTDLIPIAADSILWSKVGVLLPPKAQKALQVASAVALAQDGDAVRAALESAIAPPDRYLAKRVAKEQRRSLWINSYVGLTTGREWLLNGRNFEEGKFAAGIALPIGIEINGGRDGGLLLQLLDLGQVLNYRLGDTATVRRDPPDLKFQTVFSPGVVVVWRPFAFMHRRPYAFLLGASYSPFMRERKIGAATFAQADAFRLSFSLGVDVPVLP